MKVTIEEKILRNISSDMNIFEVRNIIFNLLKEHKYSLKKLQNLKKIIRQSNIKHKSIILFALDNYENTYYFNSFKNIDYGYDKLNFLSPKLRKQIILFSNKKRGQIYEICFGYMFLAYFLKSKNYTYIVDNKVFEVMIDGKKLKRRIDIYIPENKIAIEIKSGRIIKKKDIVLQILKDKELLRNKKINKCYWFLFRGASKSVLDILDKSQIEYLVFY